VFFLPLPLFCLLPSRFPGVGISGHFGAGKLKSNTLQDSGVQPVWDVEGA
jgi:hypothetical protein